MARLFLRAPFSLMFQREAKRTTAFIICIIITIITIITILSIIIILSITSSSVFGGGGRQTHKSGTSL